VLQGSPHLKGQKTADEEAIETRRWCGCAEAAWHSIKFLIRSEVPDIIRQGPTLACVTGFIVAAWQDGQTDIAAETPRLFRP
jgi:hypothetical protein